MAVIMQGLRVYFVGASGVGKTTLAKHVQARWNLTWLPSASRAVYASEKLTPDQAFASVAIADSIQEKVFTKQLLTESEYATSGFVSDRAFEHVCYTAWLSRVAWQVYRDEKYQAYLHDLRTGNCVIFHVRPHKDVNSEAVRKNDVGHARFLKWEDVCAIDGGVRTILEINDIPHIPIDMPLLKDRIRLVDGVLSLIQK